MSSRVEAAISAYSANRTESLLADLDKALVDGEFLVPVSAEVTEISPGRYDVPVICLKTNTGDGAIPAFTTIGSLLHWKPEGSKYTTLAGSALIAMAENMTEISEILVNPGGTPRGTIPRVEFRRLLSL